MSNYNFTLALISSLLVNGLSTAMKDLNQAKIELPQSKKKNQAPCSCSKSQEIDEPIMTLNEAIRHAEEKGQGTSNCSKNHRQLARWLKELKHFRDRNRSVTRIPHKSETTTSQIAKEYKAPMTLDEAISYADTKAGDRKTYAEQQYSRVAGWLQELKIRREMFSQKTEKEYASWLKKVKADRAIDTEHYKKVEIPHTAAIMTPEIKEYISSILKDMYEDKKEEVLSSTVKKYIDKVVAEMFAAMSSNNNTTTTKDNKQSSPSTIPKDRGVKIDIKDIDDDEEYL